MPRREAQSPAVLLAAGLAPLLIPVLALLLSRLDGAEIEARLYSLYLRVRFPNREEQTDHGFPR